MIEIPVDDVVSLPAEIAEGTFRVQLVRPEGIDVRLGLIDVLAEQAQGMGDHSVHASGGDKPANTMLSADELAAETGPQKLVLKPWKTCDEAVACRIADRRRP
ncbi:hypothetical protein [Phaeobacter sp. S60]|uniref:hypothetical protein n=1 Tax=Phaeobacter sp. S60 TaxID=1569353 RepID=UPI00059064A8|nr:hypothetical protein [Phaeobacter sp. S60]KII15955.1 hypothetical protein OO25_08080 [Phaeobacter sp. S60]